MSVEKSIINKLTQAFRPSHLQVINESYMHNVPEGVESHFKVIIVSDDFGAMLPVKRHQSIYSVLKEEMEGPIHALSIQALTSEQWGHMPINESPKCLGGMAIHDPEHQK